MTLHDGRFKDMPIDTDELMKWADVYSGNQKIRINQMLLHDGIGVEDTTMGNKGQHVLLALVG